VKCLDGATTMAFSNRGSGSTLYVHPEPNPNRKWVIVRTATADSQFAPAGTRVTPGWLPKMASFVQPLTKYSNKTPQNALLNLSDSGGADLPIASVRFVGLEFTVADDSIDTTTSTDPNFWWNLIVTNSYNSD